ncbi:MAG TPA: MFS transporter, partial [Thermoplasmata archaeon]
MGRWSALIRQPNFAALLTAGGASLAAPTASLVVVSWALSHAYPGVPNGQSFAALALALLGLSSTVPTLVAAVFSGTLADRVDRNYLMRLVNLVAIGSTVAIAAILIARPEQPVTIPGAQGLYLPLWVLLIYPFWAAETTAVTIFRPAFNASLPQVVARADLGTANGLVYATALLLSIAASLAASGILEVVGWGLALTVPVAFFLATQLALGLLRADLRPRPEGPRRRFLEEAVDGYRYLWRRRELFELTVSALAINFFSAVAFVELSLYATFSLGVSNAILLGALISGGSLGAAVGTLAINRFRFERRAGRFLAVLTVCQGLTVVALGFTHSIWFALPTMFLFGLFPGMFMTVFLATIQA